MKKIGIITTSCVKNGTYGCNYGAILQGYALVKQLRILGYEAYDLNYTSVNEYRPQQYSVLKRTLLRFRLLFNVKLVKYKLKEHKNKENILKLASKFKEFIYENDLTYESGKFYTIEELHAISGEFYAFVTGSDVVWNPYLHNGVNDEGYFLNFTEKSVKKIAYAPSIGASTYPDSAKENLKELLERFNAVSIREKTGSDLIRIITGLDVPVVLDPTLLLEPCEYESIVKVPQQLPKDYIAVYKFGHLSHTQEQINEMSEKLKLPIVYIPAGDVLSDQPDYSIGPGEFIGVIRNARIVLTDSFHCTVFCLINRTPFFTFCRTMPSSETNINSRMLDLLKMVDLEKRMIMPGENIDYSIVDNIDFKKAEKIIADKRKESLEYLKNALK